MATPLTVGLPAEWGDFERRHVRLLKDVIPPLMDVAAKVVARTMESEHPHERLVFLLGRHVPEDFNEIFLLAANGYGIGALKLLRPMYERVVTMMFLIRNPEKAQDFFDWVLVEKQKTLNHLKDEGDDPTNDLTAEEIKQVKAEYERVRHKFPKKAHSWISLDLKSMAHQVGVGRMYLSLCHWPTLQVHTTLIGMRARMEITAEGGVGFKIGAQRTEADLALLGAHFCLLLALDSHIAHFNLPIDLRPLLDEYKKYWGRETAQVDAPGVDGGELPTP